MPPELVRLATWNIHSAVGGDFRHDPSRIREVLREIGADIVALQEVPSVEADGAFLRELTGAFDMHAAVGRTMMRRDAAFGNALLSRFPLASHQGIELTVGRREPRGAIDAHIDVDGRVVRVVATHLGLQPSERRAQVKRILGAIDAEPDRPTVLMGDLNEWYLWGRPLRWLRARFRPAPAPPTFPARLPTLSLDRIWIHPPGVLRNVRVHRSRLARVASDHLPLVGELWFTDYGSTSACPAPWSDRSPPPPV